MSTLRAQFLELLSYKRPADSAGEQEFIQRYIDVIPGMACDAYGNRFIKIGRNPSTMFTSHTDTVHKTSGRQKVWVDDTLDEAFINPRSKHNCLGADDAAGVFIMLQMIAAQTPGLYVFHRAEEIGGLGSSHIASTYVSLFYDDGYYNNDDKRHILDDIRACVSFDRRGTDEVITHQGGERCCSDNFAVMLAAELGHRYRASPDGVFTDSANYTHIIPECTNIGVGYECEHTQAERVNIGHVLWLAKRCTELSWSWLPIERDPDTREYLEWQSYGGYDDGYYNDETDITWFSNTLDATEYCRDNPDEAAAIIMKYQRELNVV